MITERRGRRGRRGGGKGRRRGGISLVIYINVTNLTSGFCSKLILTGSDEANNRFTSLTLKSEENLTLRICRGEREGEGGRGRKREEEGGRGRDRER